MPARRSSLKLLHEDPVAKSRRTVRDARVGGLGIDWQDVPPEVAASEPACVEWRRLAKQYEGGTRFREADRAALAAFCISKALYDAASRSLLAEGLTRPGRSSADRGRTVKSPHLTTWSQTSTQLRYWARELALTPDARGRTGLTDDGTSQSSDEEADVFGTLLD